MAPPKQSLHLIEAIPPHEQQSLFDYVHSYHKVSFNFLKPHFSNPF